MNAREQLWVPPSSSVAEFRKADPPKTGPAYGPWAGEDKQYVTLPGGGVLQFDLSRLTIDDFRNMRDHYQINASLVVLSFMLHQIDWRIECDDKRIADFCEENLRELWTRLIRGMSQAFWAGRSPMVYEYENDVTGRRIKITKVKDMRPEECKVNWREVKGYVPPGYDATVPPKLLVFDGIKMEGQRFPVPVENSLWYPVLMENGDYSGRKLLKPAFPSWFFSILVHLFANRYFERFGEPLPIGRAPFEEEVEINGHVMKGREAMENILQDLRSRSVVTMPSDRHSGTNQYEWDVEYLESQMRGADFERYLMRLDEEMSLALFTPLLLLRTADVGSYNLGVGHMQMFLWMLNALAGDIKEYIDRYLIARLVDYNFSPRAPRAMWVPRKMGQQNVETIRAVITELIRQNGAKPDLEELGQAVGLTLSQVREVRTPTDADDRVGRPERIEKSPPRGVGQPRATVRRIAARLGPQVKNAFASGRFGTEDFTPSLGFRKRMTQAWMAEGADESTAEELTTRFYEGIDRWLRDVTSLGTSEYSGPEDFMEMFDRAAEVQVDRIAETR